MGERRLIVDLTKYASHVYVLVRRDELRASKIMAKRLVAHPKVTVLWNVSCSLFPSLAYLSHARARLIPDRRDRMQGRRRLAPKPHTSRCQDQGNP